VQLDLKPSAGLLGCAKEPAEKTVLGCHGILLRLVPTPSIVAVGQVGGTKVAENARLLGKGRPLEWALFCARKAVCPQNVEMRQARKAHAPRYGSQRSI
jgi:hypothetical protein